MKNVFLNDRDFSVREYWRRMKASIGELYLGMDPHPREMPIPDGRDGRYEREVADGRYAAEQATANPAIGAVTEPEAFEVARACAERALKAWERQGNSALTLEEFASSVLGDLSHQWFGLPDGEIMQSGGVPATRDAVHVPFHFIMPSRYIFPPAANPVCHHGGAAARQAAAGRRQSVCGPDPRSSAGNSPAGCCRRCFRSLPALRGSMAPSASGLPGRWSALCTVSCRRCSATS